MNFREFILMGDRFGEGEAIGRGNRKVRGTVWERDGWEGTPSFKEQVQKEGVESLRSARDPIECRGARSARGEAYKEGFISRPQRWPLGGSQGLYKSTVTRNGHQGEQREAPPQTQHLRGCLKRE